MILAITTGGFMHSSYLRRRESLSAKRDAIEKACNGVDLDFAMDVFGDASFEGKVLTALDHV